ncbi:MAG: hypothetical protein ACXWPM_06270 [Bdellovibrionota bacterium]
MRKRINPLRGERGQAVVEYVLLLFVMLTLVLVMKKGFKSIVFAMWKDVTRNVAAACPGCSTNGQNFNLGKP